MTAEAKEKKSFKYMVTMRWYVETDEELVPGAAETDNKILEILRHRKDGSKSCSTCPTRNNEGYSILDYHYFMGNKDPYMSCLLYTSPSPRDKRQSRMPSSA